VLCRHFAWGIERTLQDEDMTVRNLAPTGHPDADAVHAATCQVSGGNSQGTT
jgi:hypothetical protein